MARFLVFFLASLVLVFAEQRDELEDIANNILAGIHTHLGGESGQNSLYTFVSNSDFAKQAALELNKTRREHVEEAVGSGGITFVSVTRGKKQVNVTTAYGVGAGAVINVREETKGEAVEPTTDELNEVTQPLYDQYVKNILGAEESDPNEIRVELGSEGHTGFRFRDARERVQARVRAGFRVEARTRVSKRG